MEGDLNIRRATEGDAEEVSAIYNWYVANTAVTFETAVIVASEMRQRIKDSLAHFDWIVGELNCRIVGYAYYGSFRPRAAYSQTVESTIYLSQESQGKGFGRRLYSALIQSAAGKGFRELIGVIALPNPASLALHAGLGFREVGVLRGVGYKFGRYHDVALWQRSAQATTD
ncbi:MAG: N-acetyltransferase family protein [Terracidiphilus sp.]